MSNRLGARHVALLLAFLAATASSCVDGSSLSDPQLTPVSVSTSSTTTTTPTSTTTSATTELPSSATTELPSEVTPLRSDVALVNLRPRDTPFGELTPWPDGIGYIRAWGGSRGMVTFPTEESVPAVLRDITDRDAYDVVTDDEVLGLLQLQEEHGVGLVYLVNINDTLDSQLSFIAHLRDTGLNIAMLEMGNELYLPKFPKGDLTKLGVTRAWTVDQYVELLAEWGPILRAANPTVPIYALAASHGSTTSNADRNRGAWNDELLMAIDSQPGLAGMVDGVTFHIYVAANPGDFTVTGEEGAVADDQLDLGFLDDFGELPVAITESGASFAPSDLFGPEGAESFWTELRAALGPSDLFGVHVMYNGGRKSAEPGYALFDDAGRTPVGDRFAQWLADWASAT